MAGTGFQPYGIEWAHRDSPDSWGSFRWFADKALRDAVFADLVGGCLQFFPHWTYRTRDRKGAKQ